MRDLLTRLKSFWPRALLAATVGAGIGLTVATAVAMGLSYVVPARIEPGATGMLTRTTCTGNATLPERAP